MEAQIPVSICESLDEIVLKCCSDLDFRNAFIVNPKKILQSRGVEIRKDQEIMVVDLSNESVPPLVIHLPPMGAELYPTTQMLEDSLLYALDRENCGDNEIKKLN
ncbi:MAG: hypothetical protein JNL17_07460 [Cyclobacteriaceae bacterium]|nr:hypothetical protein [Cyclobacteriaceae bacterium]